MRRPLLRSLLPLLLLVGGCDKAPPVAPQEVATAPTNEGRPAERGGASEATAPSDRPSSASIEENGASEAAADDPAPAPAPLGTRGEVVLVELGAPFPADLVDEIEQQLRNELQVDVIRHERVPLPRAAYYAPRKRYRADTLLAHLLTLIPEAPPTTRALGLTTVDISTTKGPHHDWGIFGLGQMPGQAAVISMHRLKRGAKDRAQLRFRVATTAVHEVGHTFGLDHCPEAQCPMQDAEGSIANTDSSTGHLGPGCRETLDANFPQRPSTSP